MVWDTLSPSSRQIAILVDTILRKGLINELMELIMGENLICPKCRKSPLKWLNPEDEDLLESGIMECRKCKAQFKGIPGWMEASFGKEKRSG